MYVDRFHLLFIFFRFPVEIDLHISLEKAKVKSEKLCVLFRYLWTIFLKIALSSWLLTLFLSASFNTNVSSLDYSFCNLSFDVIFDFYKKPFKVMKPFSRLQGTYDLESSDEYFSLNHFIQHRGFTNLKKCIQWKRKLPLTLTNFRSYINCYKAFYKKNIFEELIAVIIFKWRSNRLWFRFVLHWEISSFHVGKVSSRIKLS